MVITVAKTKAPLLSQGILKIIPDHSIKDAPQTDIFAVFGGSDDVAANGPDVTNQVSEHLLILIG